MSLALPSSPMAGQMGNQPGPTPTATAGQPRRDAGPRTLKLTPKIRVSPLTAPAGAIPLGAFGPFIEHAFILEREEIEQAPYVVAFPEGRVLGGRGDRVYARGLREAGGAFRLIRAGGPYRDPRSGEILGYLAQSVAEASLERAGDPAVLRIDAIQREVAIGDRLIPLTTNEPLLSLAPRPAPAGRQGQILAVLNGVSQIGGLNLVVINLGREQGVEAGQLFDVFNGGEQVRDRVRAESSDWSGRNMRFWSEEFWYGDYRTDRWISDEFTPDAPLPLHRGASPMGEDVMLPLERAGTLLVFRSFARLSFALVTEAIRPMHVQDQILAPRP